MAKEYTPGTWVDESLVGDPRYDIKGDGGDPIYEDVQIVLSTEVAQAGTPVDSARMTNIEDGIDAMDTLLRAIATTKTISGGVLTCDLSRHKVSPESGTEDEIDTISGLEPDTDFTLFAAAPNTDTITFKHGTGNISCFGNADISLTGGRVSGYFDGTTVYLSGGGGGGGGGSLSRIWVAG